jgi:hypothetical protein
MGRSDIFVIQDSDKGLFVKTYDEDVATLSDFDEAAQFVSRDKAEEARLKVVEKMPSSYLYVVLQLSPLMTRTIKNQNSKR